jgi:hypothetical protein
MSTAHGPLASAPQGTTQEPAGPSRLNGAEPLSGAVVFAWSPNSILVRLPVSAWCCRVAVGIGCAAAGAWSACRGALAADSPGNRSLCNSLGKLWISSRPPTFCADHRASSPMPQYPAKARTNQKRDQTNQSEASLPVHMVASPHDAPSAERWQALSDPEHGVTCWARRNSEMFQSSQVVLLGANIAPRATSTMLNLTQAAQSMNAKELEKSAFSTRPRSSLPLDPETGRFRTLNSFEGLRVVSMIPGR